MRRHARLVSHWALAILAIVLTPPSICAQDAKDELILARVGSELIRGSDLLRAIEAHRSWRQNPDLY